MISFGESGQSPVNLSARFTSGIKFSTTITQADGCFFKVRFKLEGFVVRLSTMFKVTHFLIGDPHIKVDRMEVFATLKLVDAALVHAQSSLNIVTLSKFNTRVVEKRDNLTVIVGIFQSSG